MFSSLLLTLPLVLGVVASPMGKRQDPGPSCSNFGSAGFDVAHGFTLAAYSTTGTNTNSTGVPLVLGQAGAVDGAEFHVLSTWASYPYNDFPTFDLVNGALLPNAANGEPVSVTDSQAQAGAALEWVTGSDLPAPAQIYCGVADTDPAHGGYPWLAVNGDTGSFSLCSTGDYALAQNNVIYKATAGNNEGYLFESCYPVVLQIVGLY